MWSRGVCAIEAVVATLAVFRDLWRKDDQTEIYHNEGFAGP